MEKIQRVSGTGCVLPGDNIDTDRIIPARYLRCISFDGLGENAFEDDRIQAKGNHPFDDRRFDGASLLIVDHNFGSGSSREHAPQALMRRGFRAFIGGSFAEIFAGNCTSLGLPCVTLPDTERVNLMDSVNLDPGQELVLDLEARTLTFREGTLPVEIPDGMRQQLLRGTWNATAVLLEAGESIEYTASQLPYMSGFSK